MRSVIALLALSGLAIASKVAPTKATGLVHHHHGENTHAHKHGLVRRHIHGETAKPVRKPLLRFPLRKAPARKVNGGETVVRSTKSLGMFKLFGRHHHHGEHSHGRPLLRRLQRGLRKFGEDVVRKVKSLGLLKLSAGKHHVHGEGAKPVRKSLLRFPLRKAPAKARGGETVVRKSLGMFKLAHHHHHGEHHHHHHASPLRKFFGLARRHHHHHGEHTHAHRHGVAHRHHHHHHGEHTHAARPLSLFKLGGHHHHHHGEHTHAHRHGLAARLAQRLHRHRHGEHTHAHRHGVAHRHHHGEHHHAARPLLGKIRSAFGLFKLGGHKHHHGEHSHSHLAARLASRLHNHRHGEHSHGVARLPTGKPVQVGFGALGLFKKSVRLARRGEGEEVVRKTNKKAVNRKAERKARKAAEKRRRLHKRANKRVNRGEGEEVVKRTAKKTRKGVKALGLFELSNLLNLNQF